jgi:mono/diheme cytochrome c family protein
MPCSSNLDHRCCGRILMVRSIYPPGVGPAPADNEEVAQAHLLLRVLQRTCREMDPFKLSRIALFGFSALASASPNCASAGDEVARGKYIVENVAKCTECHTPRGQNEKLGKGLSLSGAKLEVKPITPNASWAESAPNIRGIRGYNEEAAVTLFSRGIAKNYGELAPPMPSYKMTEDDAGAVYKYLKSLEP